MSWSNVSLIVKSKDCPINFAASGAAQYFKVLITHKKIVNSANHARSDWNWKEIFQLQKKWLFVIIFFIPWDIQIGNHLFRNNRVIWYRLIRRSMRLSFLRLWQKFLIEDNCANFFKSSRRQLHGWSKSRSFEIRYHFKTLITKGHGRRK